VLDMDSTVKTLYGSVANFLGGHAIPMNMTGFIPPTNRIAVPDTFRPPVATGLSGSCA
jgi:hypothetical protein